MWAGLEDIQIGKARMTERMRDMSFWGVMVDKGAKVVEHDNTPRSARNIIKMIMDKQAVPLQMQRELVQNGGSIADTSAGQQLNADFSETSAKVTRELEELKRERVQNAADMQELREQLEEAEKEGEKLRRKERS
jgi:hypothetical protein